MVYTGYLLSERGFSGDILQCVARNNCIFIQLLTMCSIIKSNFQTGYTNKAKVFEANNPFASPFGQVQRPNPRGPAGAQRKPPRRQ